MGQALIATLQEALNKDFTANVHEAYMAFYAFVTTVMREGLLEYKAEELGQCI